MNKNRVVRLTAIFGMLMFMTTMAAIPKVNAEIYPYYNDTPLIHPRHTVIEDFAREVWSRVGSHSNKKDTIFVILDVVDDILERGKVYDENLGITDNQELLDAFANHQIEYRWIDTFQVEKWSEGYFAASCTHRAVITAAVLRALVNLRLIPFAIYDIKVVHGAVDTTYGTDIDPLALDGHDYIQGYYYDNDQKVYFVGDSWIHGTIFTSTAGYPATIYTGQFGGYWEPAYPDLGVYKFDFLHVYLSTWNPTTTGGGGGPFKPK